MTVIRTRIVGLRELRRKLRALDEKEIKRLAQTPVEVAGKVFELQARANAPRDPAHRGGEILAESMVTVPGDRIRSRSARKLLNKRRAQALVGPTDFTGLFIEFGWRHYRGGRNVSAQPFLRPAFDSKKREAGALGAKALGVAIEDRAARL